MALLNETSAVLACHASVDGNVDADGVPYKPDRDPSTASTKSPSIRLLISLV